MAPVHERLEFAPPAAPGMAGALILALLTHALLLIALGMGVQWKSKIEPEIVQAELWANLPQIAEPSPPIPAPEPPAAAPLATAPEQATPTPTPPRPAPPTAPGPTLPEPSIVQEKLRVQKEKLQQEKLAAEKAAKDKTEKEKLEKLEKEQLENERLEKAKVEKEKQEKLRQEQIQKDQLEQEKVAKEKANRKRVIEAPKPDAHSEEEIALAETQKREELRQQNLKRIAGMAGGTAAQNAGPSAEYPGRIRARIKPNITYTDTITGNPTAEVEVRTSPDGTIISRKISKSSGVKSWDDAVLAAIDKTEVLPRDVDGRVPSALVISFRPRD